MEAGSNKISRHYFAVENKLKPDDDVSQCWRKFMNKSSLSQTWFTGVIGETKGDVSYYNQIFLRLKGEETVQVDNHFEVPLPLKSTDVTFPNNKSAAMKRLHFMKWNPLFL